MKKIILASGSPRRRELLGLAGLNFEVILSECDENADINDPEQLVLYLSELKCMDVALRLIRDSDNRIENMETSYLVIGADTVVSLDGHVFGKPGDADEAVRMLKTLSGRTHQVYTGVSVYDTLEKKKVSFFEKTDVTMYDLSDDEIEAYVKTGEPLDKAGSYGIQGKGALLIREIHGDYNNVVGLPVSALWHILKDEFRNVIER